MRTGRPIAALSLAVEERATLEGWARRPKTAQALAQRARIVLGCAGGSPNTAVADKLRVSYQTVGKWRRRFLEWRLAGLLDEPRPYERSNRLREALQEITVSLRLAPLGSDEGIQSNHLRRIGGSCLCAR
jgi:winged helix-turn helix protein